VSRATGSGSATPGLTSDWNESTTSSARTRTPPTSQIWLRAAESPVVSRSKTTNSASSRNGSGPRWASETVVPVQTTRLSPAVMSARSEHASPVEIEGVAKSERAASTAGSGPRSSRMSTSRSSASRASCTDRMKANICSYCKPELIGEQRHRQSAAPPDKHRAGDGRRPEPRPHLVDSRIDRVAAVTVERQRELEHPAVLEIAHRDADERDSAALDQR